jgi:hypothetical protein
MNFLRLFEGSEAFRAKYLSGSLELKSGSGAVVGANRNPLVEGPVLRVLRQAQAPTTYKAGAGLAAPPRSGPGQPRATGQR